MREIHATQMKYHNSHLGAAKITRSQQTRRREHRITSWLRPSEAHKNKDTFSFEAIPTAAALCEEKVPSPKRRQSERESRSASCGGVWRSLRFPEALRQPCARAAYTPAYPGPSPALIACFVHT